MTWFRTDDTWGPHPKIQAAGLKARMLWIYGGLHCAQHLTDGRIDHTMLPMLAAIAGVGTGRKEAATLVSLDLWIDQGDNWLMKDWDEYQPSREHVENQRAKKAEAGTKGNHDRWHAAKGVRKKGCPFCFASGIAPAIPSGSKAESQKSPPAPPPTKELPVLPTTTNGRESDPFGGGEDQTNDPRIAETVALIADYELLEAQGSGVEFSRGATAYRHGIVQRLDRTARTQLATMAANEPTFTAEQLRDWYLETRAA